MSVVTPMLLVAMTGCASFGGFTPPWKKEAKAEGPKDSAVLSGAGFYREPVDPGAAQELEAAKRMFEDKKYAQAEPLFHKLVRSNSDPRWWEVGLLSSDSSNKTKKMGGRGVNPVCEAALFYEAECQRLQKNYREASDTYTKLLTEFQRSQYTAGACQGLFEIADHWLEPTRRQMDQYHEQINGKRWFVTPATYFHVSKEMPAMDAEGHAVILLNAIRLADIKGELGRKSLMYLGTIHFFRQDYKEADFYFTRYYEEFPNDQDAAKAIKQSVICKQLVTGGPVYDLRGVEESKKLLMVSMGAYPELVKEEAWVKTQLTNINIQQAVRDFKIAEFYQRTGHPGSAYFYYELVCRRYPGSEFAEKAEKAKEALKAKADKEQRQDGGPPPREQPANPAVERPIQAPPRELPPFDPRR